MKSLRQDRTREKTEKNNNNENTQFSEALEDLRNAALIPQELTTEILLRLPAETLVRVVCPSKLFAPIIRRRDFVHSFLTQSLTRPRFLFILEYIHGLKRNSLLFISSSPYDGALSSLKRTKCPTPDLGYKTSHSVGGLILSEADARLIVCNPTTGHVITLPKIRSRRKSITSLFGYDPIDHQFKVLCMTQLSVYHQNRQKLVAAGEYQVLTLGAQRSWRMIECNTPHCPTSREGLCINGVIYYGACIGKSMEELMLVSFDVRSEKFDFIRFPEDVKRSRIFLTTLINYQGKIAVVDNGPGYSYYLWILEDAEKHEWSKIYVVHEYFNHKNLHVRGTTRTHEIILAPFHFDGPFYIAYYNVKRNSIRRVKIEGLEHHGHRHGRFLDEFSRILTFSDHAENIMRL